MRVALQLALRGKGKTHPNPAVGAVVVKGGRIVGRGFHRRSGLPHAEIEAMRDAGRHAKGADLYVTLEPCCHQGQTPPCTRAIIDAGVGRVFASTIDPNPLVRGKGIRELRRAGIRVETGLEAEGSKALNEAYHAFMRTGRPFVTLKVAQTLDGKIATRTGDARWITSRSARDRARAMRSEAQAILVGAGTVLADDPLLLPRPSRKKDYLRCVLDARLRTSPASRLARTARAHPVIIYCARPGRRAEREFERRKAALEKMGVEVVVEPARRPPATSRLRAGWRSDAESLPVDPLVDLLVDPRNVLGDLASRRVMHVWVEGGSRVLTSFLRVGLVDRMLVFVAPKIMGGGSLDAFGDTGCLKVRQCNAFEVKDLERVGIDVLLTLYPRHGARRAR